MDGQTLDAIFDSYFAEFSSDEVSETFAAAGVAQVEYTERVFVTAPEQDQTDADWSMV